MSVACPLTRVTRVFVQWRKVFVNRYLLYDQVKIFDLFFI